MLRYGYPSLEHFRGVKGTGTHDSPVPMSPRWVSRTAAVDLAACGFSSKIQEQKINSETSHGDGCSLVVLADDLTLRDMDDDVPSI